MTSADPDEKKLVDTYLRRFQHVHQAFSISADDGRVDLHSRPLQRKSTGTLDYAFRTPLEMSVTRRVSPEELARCEATNFTHLAASPGLVLPDPASLGPADVPRVEEALRRNQALLEEVQARQRAARAEALKSGVVSGLASAVFVPVNAASDVLRLPSLNPLAGGLSLTGGRVLEDYAAMNLKRVVSTPDDSRRAAAILRQRISEYQTLKRHLDAGR
jgi:hypothetical protein